MTWPKGPWAQSLRKMGKREKWVPRNVQLAAGPALGSLHSQLAQLASRFETWTKMMQHRFFGALVGGSTSSRFAAGSTCLAHRPQPLHTRSAPLFFVHAAHKKGGGSTKNGRDSNSQRRGIKVYGGQPVKAGGIIFRQVGSEFKPGPGVSMGKDYTIFATQPGIVVYQKNKYIKKITVIPKAQYEVPEGQRKKPDSRRQRQKKLFTPRAVLRAQAAQGAAASS